MEEREGALPWQLVGYDTFSDEYYPLLNGDFTTPEAATEAAAKRFGQLEKDQPSKHSGGQQYDGIQDRIFLKGPDGSFKRLYKEAVQVTQKPK